MILSLTHDFIFVHVPKTAGSSLSRALRPVARPARRSLGRSLTRRLPLTEAPETAHFRIHETAAAIRAKLSAPVYARFFSFAVVRDPFDHAVSHYEYLKQHCSARIARRFARMEFEAYLCERLKPHLPGTRPFVRLPDQAHFLVDAQGGLLVDCALHFETLDTEFAALTEALGLGRLSLVRINETRAKSPGRGLTDYYDAATTEMVRSLYARDFALFDYPREPGA